jgi:hypothetical protein
MRSKLTQACTGINGWLSGEQIAALFTLLARVQ